MELNPEETKSVEKALRAAIDAEPQSPEGKNWRRLLSRLQGKEASPAAFQDGFRYDYDDPSGLR
ncbi:hypothetical protein C8P63_108140 [Melghirimyces profundicolus]|uniref:Uncharacterized protein n=1 Tax=Melghirimyces profundicolus TaxID=1242148 RepID=A0A2T6BXN3_9BACL|nr:hypothetical protein [Melghirimyces profundicolus]PTX60830.1 hypothetical protein C8P63_108140 [Melghirimyces profundicolus]